MGKAFFLIFIPLLANILFVAVAHATSYTVDIFAHVPGCGDGLIQSPEECDGINSGGATCETLGFDEGTLSCSSACTFVTSSCTIDTRSSGGTRVPTVTTPLPDTNVIVYGLGAPLSTVSLLKDGQRVATVPVKEDGTFQMTISGLGTGTYRFQLVSDITGFSAVRSEVLVLRVLKDSNTKVGPVVLSPHVRYGYTDNRFFVSGYTAPTSKVSLRKNGFLESGVTTDTEGAFTFYPDSIAGDAFIVSLDLLTGFSATALPFIQPAPTIENVPRPCSLRGDVNDDCRVNVIDFFVARFQYITDVVGSTLDFDDNGEVTIVDFSIMAYYWTG